MKDEHRAQAQAWHHKDAQINKIDPYYVRNMFPVTEVKTSNVNIYNVSDCGNHSHIIARGFDFSRGIEHSDSRK